MSERAVIVKSNNSSAQRSRRDEWVLSCSNVPKASTMQNSRLHWIFGHWTPYRLHVVRDSDRISLQDENRNVTEWVERMYAVFRDSGLFYWVRSCAHVEYNLHKRLKQRGCCGREDCEIPANSNKMPYNQTECCRTTGRRKESGYCRKDIPHDAESRRSFCNRIVLYTKVWKRETLSNTNASVGRDSPDHIPSTLRSVVRLSLRQVE